MKSTGIEIPKFIPALAGAVLALSSISGSAIAGDEEGKTALGGSTADVKADFGRGSPAFKGAAGIGAPRSAETAPTKEILVRCAGYRVSDVDVNTVVGQEESTWATP